VPRRWYWPFAAQAEAVADLSPAPEARYSFEEYMAQLSSYGWFRPSFEQTLANGQRVSWPDGNYEGHVARIGSNAAAWTVTHFVARQFSAGRFTFRRLNGGRLSEFFTSRELAPFQNNTPGMTQGQILARAYLDAVAAGNSYWTTPSALGLRPGPAGDRALRLPPQQVKVVLVPGPGDIGFEKAGYLYETDPHDRGSDVFLRLDQVAHFMPWPDPRDPWRGMSCLTPLIRQVYTDELLTQHVAAYFSNAATPNLIVKYPIDVEAEELDRYKAVYEKLNAGPENAGRTAHIGGGVDITPVGANLADAGAALVQAGNQAALAAAFGVPAILVGFSGASSSEPEYIAQGQARRLFADGTLHPLWADAAAAFAVLIRPPAGAPAELTIDTRDVPLLREDAKDAADTLLAQITAINQAVMQGWDPEAAKAAVMSGDLSLLTHTGLVSVQLYPAGQGPATLNGDPNA
jgi:phage portal protein BeeE